MIEDEKYYYDAEAAERPVEWIEAYCVYTDGKKMGQPLVLVDFQKEILRKVFGWKQKSNDQRKYTKVYIHIPRGNGKSTFGSAIALYMLVGDKEGAAEIYSCAGAKDQAQKVFNPAKLMVGESPPLSSILKVGAKAIFDYETHSTYQVVSADGKLQHGHKPHGVLFDEVHVQPNGDLWESFDTALWKRDQPIMWALTTAGHAGTFAEEIHDYAVKVRDGVINDETFLPYIWGADPDEKVDDPFSPETWKKVNPGWDFMNHREFEAASLKAKSSPTFLNSFKRLNLNIWVSVATAWLDIMHWDRCDTAPVTLETMRGKQVFVGIDKSSVRDLTSVALFEPETYQCFWLHFCPEEQIHSRSAFNISYDKWEHGGWIIPVPGNAIDSATVLSRTLKTLKNLDVEIINYDRKFMEDVVNGLIEKGYHADEVVQPFGQGFISMNAPMKMMEELILKGLLNHGNNPVMRWQMTNVVAVEDDAGNIKPSKKKSKDKIDGVVALIMAIGGWMNWKNENIKKKPKYVTADQVLR